MKETPAESVARLRSRDGLPTRLQTQDLLRDCEASRRVAGATMAAVRAEVGRSRVLRQELRQQRAR